MNDLNTGLGKQGSDYGRNDPRPKRTVEFSQTECTHVVLYDSINDSGDCSAAGLSPGST